MNADPAPRPPPFLAEFRHVWLLFIAVGIFNLVLLRRHLRGSSAQRPELADGYRRYFAAVAVFLLLPWLVMGAGIEIGGVPSPFSFLQPDRGNPYVIAFYAVITILVATGSYWMFFRRGAEFLIEHPGLMRNLPKSPTAIRVFCAFMLVFWLVMLVLRWLNLLPAPPFA